MRLTRHFVTVGTRRVHYTRMGEGPAVCLLHASPCSAKVLRLPQTVFASHFTALAFDTPGFGLSDLLPLEQPEIEDFADGLAEVLTALGIEQTATHGRHTGASIAVEFAARHPERCAMALTDGFPIFSAGVAEDRIKRYLLPIEPRWDGGHLLWLWFRYRDQHVFWPWHEQDAAHRSDADVPDADFLHRGIVELLEAGDCYRIGYASAYRHRGLAVLDDLRVPVCFGNRPGDSQHRTIHHYPDHAWTMEMPREAWAAAVAEREVLRRHPARGSPPAPPRTAPIAGRTTTDFVESCGRQILVRMSGELGKMAPLILAPHVPGSSATYDGLVSALGQHVPVIAFDPPGHGESEPRDDGAQSPDAWSAALWDVCDALGVRQAHLMGHNAGAATVVAAALTRPDRVLSLVLDGPIALTEAQRAEMAPRWAPDTIPDWDGTHLLRMWHMRRDMALWFPWWARDAVHACTCDANLGPERLHLEFREMAKQPRSFAPAWRAAVEWPLHERLGTLPHSVAFLSGAGDLFGRCLPLAQSVSPGASVYRYSRGEERAEAVVHALRTSA